MEGYPRDLLGGIGRGDAPAPLQEQGLGPALAEEVELSLGLSLGGRFGVDRKGEKLARSSSMTAVMTAPVEAPALGRTTSLPVETEASEVGRKQGLDGWGSSRETGGPAEEPAARLRPSLSPSSGSSDGEGQRLQDTLVRSTSLPASMDAAGIEEWRKRKAAQSLKRLELKRKRVERRNSLTCNTLKEAGGQIVEEVMRAPNDKLHQAISTSHDSFSAARRKPNSASKGTAEAHSLSSAGPPAGEVASCATVASPPPSSLAGRAAALGSSGYQQSTSGTYATRARSLGEAEKTMMQEMPSVFTKDLPNGNRLEGFLYKYRKGEQVRIVCICHGSFHTPAGFVEHAGGGNVSNPLRHIVVTPLENL